MSDICYRDYVEFWPSLWIMKLRTFMIMISFFLMLLMLQKKLEIFLGLIGRSHELKWSL
ncbi:hypothetical protein CY35_18G101600 [Sphagnum magellanicum]|nr:hypothetical protein CY35_18G101600 [Sphagnum magellanicum]